MPNFLMIGALVSALTGAVSDVRRNRIPNWLTYGSLATGLVVQGCLEGWHGLRAGLLGALVGGGVFFLFFVLGGMGAGDVKLMAAVGAWVGVHQALITLICTALAGGILAVFYIVFYRRVGRTFRNMAELIRFHLTSGVRPHPELNMQEPGAIRLPYGLAIAAGTFCVFFSSTSFWRG